MKLETVLNKAGVVCAPEDWVGNSLRDSYKRSEINIGFEKMILTDAANAHELMRKMERIKLLLSESIPDVKGALEIANDLCKS